MHLARRQVRLPIELFPAPPRAYLKETILNLIRALIALLLMAASAATLAQPGGCAPDDALLQLYVDAHANWTRVATQFKPITSSAARKYFEEIRDRFHRNSTPERLEQDLAFKRKDIASFSSNSPAAPKIRAETNVVISMIECEIAAKRNSSKIASQISKSDVLPQDGWCNVAGFDQKFAALKQRNPQQPNWGMNATYQYSYFLGSEGIKTLLEYRTCMNDADFTANYDALKGMRDKGREGCLKTSSTGDCQASYPGSAAQYVPKPQTTPLTIDSRRSWYRD